MHQTGSARLDETKGTDKTKSIIDPEAQKVPKPETPIKLKVNPTTRLLGYMKKELNMFFWGTLTLIGGNIGTLAIPYYIGLFIDDMTNKNYDNIPRLSYELLILIFVSTRQTKSIDFLSLRVHQRTAVQSDQ